MFRTLWTMVGVGLILAFPTFASGLSSEMGPTAQKIVQLSNAGVDESVILTYIRTQTAGLVVTAEDLALMKAAGVSPAILAAVVHRDSAPSVRAPLTEAQLYRLYYGYVYHEGGAFDVSGGLPATMKLDLESDAQASPYIRSFTDQNDKGRLLNWTGIGLVIGGLLYTGISYGVSPSNSTVNNTIGFTAVGVGVLSSIIGNIFNAVAYRSLYDGLYQYNRDLIHQNTGGNS